MGLKIVLALLDVGAILVNCNTLYQSSRKLAYIISGMLGVALAGIWMWF